MFSKAVITVPAYFTDPQKETTKATAALAGLEVIYVLNEPTAAALAYGFEFPIKENVTLMVVDLGGGTYDVSIIDAKDMSFTVSGQGGNPHFGGQDIDIYMADFCMAEFKAKTGKEFPAQGPTYAKLIRRCEKAKIRLSDAEMAQVQVEFEGTEIKVDLSRGLFEDIIAGFIRDLQKTIDVALSSINLESGDVDVVLLVGGATRVPAVVTYMESLFGKEKVSQQVSRAHSVARGAAILAAKLSGLQIPKLENFTWQDRTTFNVGVLSYSAQRGEPTFVVLIKENTLIPAQSVKEGFDFTNRKDDAMQATVKIAEGPYTDAENVFQNPVIGFVTVYFKEKLKQGGQRIKVFLDIDSKGNLKATATDVRSGSTETVGARITKWQMHPDEIKYTADQLLRWKKDSEDEELKRKEAVDFRVACLALTRRIGNKSQNEPSISNDLKLLLTRVKELQNTGVDVTHEEKQRSLNLLRMEFENLGPEDQASPKRKGESGYKDWGHKAKRSAFMVCDTDTPGNNMELPGSSSSTSSKPVQDPVLSIVVDLTDDDDDSENDGCP